MADNVRDVLWVAVPETRQLRYVSVAYERIWGRPRHPTPDCTSPWPESVHPDDVTRVEAALDRDALAGKYDEVYRIVRPDASERWIWDRAVAVRDAAGHVRHLAGIAADVTERKESDDELRRSHGLLRALSARREAVREEERARVAREIHDQLGQSLTALRLDICWLAGHLPPRSRAIRAKLNALSRQVEGTLGSVRTIATVLRPAPLDHLGLVAALEWHARQFQSLSGVPVRLDLSFLDGGLDPELATAVFRICQEALTNVARHAGASRVDVRLFEDGENLVLEVRDDGRGITDAERFSGSLGLLGMQERARAFSGDLEVRRLPSHGTSVTLHLPHRRVAGPP